MTTRFAERVRRELVERPPRRICCRRSFLSGLVRHAGTLEVSSGPDAGASFTLTLPT